MGWKVTKILHYCSRWWINSVWHLQRQFLLGNMFLLCPHTSMKFDMHTHPHASGNAGAGLGQVCCPSFRCNKKASQHRAAPVRAQTEDRLALDFLQPPGNDYYTQDKHSPILHSNPKTPILKSQSVIKNSRQRGGREKKGLCMHKYAELEVLRQGHVWKSNCQYKYLERLGLIKQKDDRKEGSWWIKDSSRVRVKRAAAKRESQRKTKKGDRRGGEWEQEPCVTTALLWKRSAACRWRKKKKKKKRHQNRHTW